MRNFRNIVVILFVLLSITLIVLAATSRTQNRTTNNSDEAMLENEIVETGSEVRSYKFDIVLENEIEDILAIELDTSIINDDLTDSRIGVIRYANADENTTKQLYQNLRIVITDNYSSINQPLIVNGETLSGVGLKAGLDELELYVYIPSITQSDEVNIIENRIYWAILYGLEFAERGAALEPGRVKTERIFNQRVSDNTVPVTVNKQI